MANPFDPAGTIHDDIREKVELAITYAEDGAFYTASDIFAELSDLTRLRARECDPMLAESRSMNTQSQIQAAATRNRGERV